MKILPQPSDFSLKRSKSDSPLALQVPVMLFTLARSFGGLAIALGASSCISVTPQVQTHPATELGEFDAIYFTFENNPATNHSITEVLQQEFERRGYAVLLEEPEERIQDRVMRLHVDFAGDKRTSGRGRADHLRYLDFRLERMRDGTELGRVTYDGLALDRIEQRELARQIVDRLLQGDDG